MTEVVTTPVEETPTIPTAAAPPTPTKHAKQRQLEKIVEHFTKLIRDKEDEISAQSTPEVPNYRDICADLYQFVKLFEVFMPRIWRISTNEEFLFPGTREAMIDHFKYQFRYIRNDLGFKICQFRESSLFSLIAHILDNLDEYGEKNVNYSFHQSKPRRLCRICNHLNSNIRATNQQEQ